MHPALSFQGSSCAMAGIFPSYSFITSYLSYSKKTLSALSVDLLPSQAVFALPTSWRASLTIYSIQNRAPTLFKAFSFRELLCAYLPVLLPITWTASLKATLSKSLLSNKAPYFPLIFLSLFDLPSLILFTLPAIYSLKASFACPHLHKFLLLPVLSQNCVFPSLIDMGFTHRAPILNILFHSQTICVIFFFNLEKISHHKASI